MSNELVVVEADDSGVDEIVYEENVKKMVPRRIRRKVSPHDPGVIEKICAGLVAGKTLGRICREDPSLPQEQQIYYALSIDDESDFALAYKRARSYQQDALVAQTIDMADSATEANYNAVKLRIHARQWYAGKIAPKKYGEKQDTGQGLVQVLNLNITSDEHEQIINRLSTEF